VSILSFHRPAILKEIPHDRHAVIEASAGTGKTHAIEYLVLDLLLNTDSAIEDILVVTFTEKATAELRTRIRGLLETVLSGAASLEERRGTELVEIDDDGRRKLETALFSFDRAPICTIHAFCRRILSDLAFDTGAGFGLEVVDARRVFHRAFRSELREVLAVQEATRRLLDEWMSDGETAGHSDLVDSLESLLREAHFNRYLQSGARERNHRATEELAEVFDAALLKTICARKNKKKSADALSAAGELASIIRRTRDSREQLRAALEEFNFDALSELPAAKENLPELRLIKALEATRVACSLDTRVVDTFLPLVTDRLSRDKRQNSEIEYGDMLQEVWQSLESDRGHALLLLLRGRFRFGLVDEFQDTDDLQWKIFRRIFVESGTSNILYVVGDPKQAIYAFRGADVITYLDARREILAAGGASVKLVENHRSSADLIKALNLILDQGASPALFSGAIRYDNPVECGRPDLRASHAAGNSVVPITLLRYCPNPGRAGVARMRASIGRHIASEIRNILFEPGSRITIGDSGKSRPVEAREIYILTRSGAEAVEIGSYLREQGIPFAFYKKDGLFQTSEAYDVLNILSAIEEPDSQSKRLKAWVSPFFAVPYRDLFDREEVTAGHALIERLYEWNALAGQERFEKLFDQLVHQSGLVGRELFLSNNERELTNYLHIFEILLEQIRKEALSLREAISRLESFIAETALPAGIDSNVQRIESERSAVQIMSVHMSKGLQADVVFLFGGTVRPNILPRLWVYHDEKHERRIAIGKDGRTLARASFEREEREENERLAYVGLTRARARVYLPVYPEGSTRQQVNGYYAALNDRLKVLSEKVERGELLASKLLQQVDVQDTIYDAESATARVERRIPHWSPPPSLLGLLNEARPESFFEALRGRSRAMLTRSYTSLENRLPDRSRANDIEAEEFKYDLDAPVETGDLKGGRRVGIFLHEVIEKLDLDSFLTMQDVGSWRAQEPVKRLFADTMSRHQVADARWFERGTEIVFNALTSRIATSKGSRIGPLYKCRNVREMEFVYPIPERAHRLLQSAPDGQWFVDRGYLKGFVDFVFEYDGMHYFADWKSDFLPAYGRDSIESHVREHYELQARIYSVGVVRLLGIRSKTDYDKRFGGLLYLFIRGMKRTGSGEEGVYFRRPGWTEICQFERALIEVVPEILRLE
jgi:exodeoxyribonuclease V beta subunit